MLQLFPSGCHFVPYRSKCFHKPVLESHLPERYQVLHPYGKTGKLCSPACFNLYIFRYERKTRFFLHFPSSYFTVSYFLYHFTLLSHTFSIFHVVFPSSLQHILRCYTGIETSVSHSLYQKHRLHLLRRFYAAVSV